MKKKAISEAMRHIGRMGGKATAKKYSHEQLSEWGREGARKRNENKAKNGLSPDTQTKDL